VRDDLRGPPNDALQRMKRRHLNYVRVLYKEDGRTIGKLVRDEAVLRRCPINAAPPNNGMKLTKRTEAGSIPMLAIFI